MSSEENNTGPPGPEKGAPQLLHWGGTKPTTDGNADVVPPETAGKPDIKDLLREYRRTCQRLALIESVFWDFVRRKALLKDQLARLDARPFCEPRKYPQGQEKFLPSPRKEESC